MNDFPQEHFVCAPRRVQCGKPATVLCRNAGGFQWLACDKKEHQHGADKKQKLTDWYGKTKAAPT